MLNLVFCGACAACACACATVPVTNLHIELRASRQLKSQLYPTQNEVKLLDPVKWQKIYFITFVL